MAEKSNFTNDEPLESQFNESASTPVEAYKVGPGHPPPDKRWKKGGASPNPRGRPRKDRSTLPDLGKAFEQAANKKVSVSRGDRAILMNRIDIGFEQLFNQFAKGDRYARRDLMVYADKLDIDLLGQKRQAIEQALTPNHQAILDAALARRSGAGGVASVPPVLAPPELADDDREESGPEPASSPTVTTKPVLPEPTPIPGKTYPKPFSQMTPLQRRIYYPEWWEKYGEIWEKHGR